jgi:CRP-like cAMP-binding protein
LHPKTFSSIAGTEAIMDYSSYDIFGIPTGQYFETGKEFHAWGINPSGVIVGQFTNTQTGSTQGFQFKGGAATLQRSNAGRLEVDLPGDYATLNSNRPPDGTPMQDALRLFSELTEDDISWVQEQGREQQVIANTVLIREGEKPEAILIVLEGLIGIEIEAINTQRIAYGGPGSLLGELSFLDGRPASATVRAVENSLLLALPHSLMEAKLANDTAFATRFYRACALITAQRLRERVGDIGLRITNQPHREGVLASVWARVSAPVEAMKETLHKADREAIRNNNELPESLATEIVEDFRNLIAFLNAEIGDATELSEPVRDKIGAQLQREFLPYMLLTRTGERYYAKPRGYAGDYLTIEWIYRNEPQGVGRLGPLLDSCFLNLLAAQAVRNRRGLLAKHIQDARERSEGRTAQITSMACGPATELFDVFATVDDPTRIHATLIDIDLQALAFVSDRCDRLKLRRQMELVHGNLVYLATGRQQLKLSDQDLVYSIGLIDYFSDKFVIELLNYVYTLLRPGGKVVLGNFHSRNTDKAMMDYILDWKLIHRTEDDMNRLYAASNFAQPCTQILFEPTGINMFAECVKQG